jgi:hypothetical protein
MKTMLFAAASALALAVGTASAGQYVPSMVVKPAHVRKAFHFKPRRGETLLYDQSESAGFAKYAVISWENDSAPRNAYTTPDLAADDFIIPGTGRHTITAVYAAGTTGSSYGIQGVNIIFFDNLRYNERTGTTKAVVKAMCPGMPVTNENTGDLVIDVSSCDTGTFKGGHDYALSIQGISAGDPIWYWQTNRKRIGRPGMWWDDGGGGSGSCYTQLTPIKTCYPTKGYGPDLAFAIYGN